MHNYRNEVDWRQMFAESAKLPLEGVTEKPVGIMVTPLDATEDLLVVMIPLKRQQTAALKEEAMAGVALVKRWGPIIKPLASLLTGRGS